MKRRMLWGVLGLVCLVGTGWGLFQISRLRDFQFFAPLVAQGPATSRRIALTFDDGPSEYTPELLALLEREQITATFFLVGRDLEAHPEWGRAIAAAGHEIGNHTYSHARMLLKSTGFMRHELSETDRLIRATGYTGPIYFRPPFGKKLFGLPWVLSQTGHLTVMWNIEPESFSEALTTPKALTAHVLERARPGAILLLHPMGGYAQTRAALPDLIRQLKDRGYTLGSVSELLNAAPLGVK